MYRLDSDGGIVIKIAPIQKNKNNRVTAARFAPNGPPPNALRSPQLFDDTVTQPTNVVKRRGVLE